jgi:hypothetical protein
MRWLFTLLFLFANAANSAKIGVFLSTLSQSQIIFGSQLAEVLASDGHEVIILRAHKNPYITTYKWGDFREIRLDALNGQPHLFEEFSSVGSEIIFSEAGLFSKSGLALGEAFHRLIAATCKGMEV